MILYHFTNIEALGRRGIRRAGLKAQDQRHHYPWWVFQPCVWFTDEAQPAVLFDRPSEVRITVSLPKPKGSEPKLLRWPELLGQMSFTVKGEPINGLRMFASLPLGRKRFWRHWWVYFGDVPLKAIRAVEDMRQA